MYSKYFSQPSSRIITNSEFDYLVADIRSFIFLGQALGTVFGLPMTGFISSSVLGWPGIFRFYGILSGIIGVLLFWLAADTPAKHPKISEAERRYVEDELGPGDEAKVMLDTVKYIHIKY